MTVFELSKVSFIAIMSLKDDRRASLGRRNEDLPHTPSSSLVIEGDCMAAGNVLHVSPFGKALSQLILDDNETPLTPFLVIDPSLNVNDNDHCHFQTPGYQQVGNLKLTLSEMGRHYGLGALLPVNETRYSRWTMEEDNRLRLAVMARGAQKPSWKQIATACFGGRRNEAQCRSRWTRVLNPSLKLDEWSKKEDAIILRLYKEGKDFRFIAKQLKGRRVPMVRERYFGQLDPSLNKDKWCEKEKEALFALVETLGPKWRQIAGHFPGRSVASCRNMWYNSVNNSKRKEKRAREIEQIVDSSESTGAHR